MRAIVVELFVDLYIHYFFNRFNVSFDSTLLNFRFFSGSDPMVNRNVIISQCLRIFKNIVHSFEPGETLNNSASHQAQNYVQRY